MSAAAKTAPVLILGGYGSLGSRTAKALRLLQPDLPIVLAGRDRARTEAVAKTLGNAEAALIDITRADLGLPGETRYSAMLTGVRDHALTTLRFAQARRVPYIAPSDAPFELGPLVARTVQAPTIPVVMLGHGMGAAPALAALAFAAEYASVDAISIGYVFDPDDPLGSASVTDMERITKVGPPPLIVRDGAWGWAAPPEIGRAFTGVDGETHQGEAVGLAEILSLGAATDARSIRIDAAVGRTATSRRGEAPSHEVIIEISGALPDGASVTRRYELVDREGYAGLSGKGIALVLERLAGLSGPLPRPGLHLPETLVEPAAALARLEKLGVEVRRPDRG